VSGEKRGGSLEGPSARATRTHAENRRTDLVQTLDAAEWRLISGDVRAAIERYSDGPPDTAMPAP
jgi:hypothetical protein